MNAERMTCTCEDFKVRGEICKHIFKILTMKMRRKGENRADRAEGEREKVCEREREKRSERWVKGRDKRGESGKSE